MTLSTTEFRAGLCVASAFVPPLITAWDIHRDAEYSEWQPEYWDLLQHNESFSQIAAFSLGGRATLTRADGPPVQVSEASATAGLPPMLGVTPILGRSFAVDEDQPGRSQYALLSYALWQSQFAGDPNILSKSVQLDGVSYSIVGVLPKQFSLGGKQDLWIPLGLDRARPNNRGSHYLHVVARLKLGTNSAKGSSALMRLAGDLRRAYPNSYGPAAQNFDMYMVRVKDQLVSGPRPALFVLLGVIGLIGMVWLAICG